MKTDIIKVTGYSPFKTLLLREFWENRRSMFYGPMVGGGISLFLILIALFGSYIGLETTQMTINDVNYYSLIEMLDEFEGLIQSKRMEIVAASMLSAGVFIAIITWFNMVFNSLGSLYDERKDNSILFWKSMPVSDLQTVAAKIISNMFITPLIALAFTFATQFVVLALLSLVTLVSGHNAWDLFIAPANLPSLFVTEFVMVIMYSLWAMPVFAYLMLASAVAKRTPLLTAVIPPVIVFVAEYILYEKSYLANWLQNQLGSMASFIDANDHESTRITTTEALEVLQSATLPSFWVGLAIAAALLYAATILRRRSNQ
ncbi:hypothetical protein [Emcibacter sp.]|uniref:hypothetical protein n=1 Tax=Emcibacter sp. TaxID=1979954 RepID=UPI002AA71008|nr:hypothetical protein [Emcibacter sp.]